MGKRRLLPLCRLALFVLIVMDLGPLQITSSTLVSSPLRRQKKSIMNLQLSPPSTSSEEEEGEGLEEDDSESGLDEVGVKVNSDEDDETREFNSWSATSPLYSPFRERQISSFLNPITSEVSKNLAGGRNPRLTFFSERERDARKKRQQKQFVVVQPKQSLSNSGPDPSRAHQMFRLLSRRNQPLVQKQMMWYPSSYKVLPELEVEEDDGVEIIPLVEKRVSDDTYYDDDDEEVNGIENSREDEEDAIDAELKHLSWQRLAKRLIQLEGLQGPFFDRGERSRLLRRTLKKRSSSSSSAHNYQLYGHGNEAKKELEAILSDDNTAVKLKRSYSEAARKVASKIDTDGDNNNNNKSNKTSENETAVVAVSKEKMGSKPHLSSTTSGKQEAEDKDKISKGKQWVPYDSERTLRSKKSWDQYFGVDKRSVVIGDERLRGFSHQKIPTDTHNNNVSDKDDDVDNNDEEEGESRDDNDSRSNNKKLQDDLIKWYFDKVLLHSSNVKPSKLLADEDEDDDLLVKKEWKKKSKASESALAAKKDDPVIEIEVWSKKVDERLRQMEDSLLSAATKLLEKQVKSGKKGELKDGVDEAEKEVVNHLKAAFSLEKMRDALEELEKTVGELENTAEKPLGEDEDSDEDEKRKKKKKKSSELVDKFSHGEDDKKKKNMKKKRTEFSVTQVESGPKDLTSEVALPVFLAEADSLYSRCPLMMDIYNYCVELSLALGEIGKVLLNSCVQHMMCYTCDKSPGLCNRAFLQGVEDLCDDDFRCQATAGAMRSVFLSNHDEFRRRNNDMCIVDQCFDLLLQEKKK